MLRVFPKEPQKGKKKRRSNQSVRVKALERDRGGNKKRCQNQLSSGHWDRATMLRSSNPFFRWIVADRRPQKTRNTKEEEEEEKGPIARHCPVCPLL